jgi:hypothetical protein
VRFRHIDHIMVRQRTNAEKAFGSRTFLIG